MVALAMGRRLAAADHGGTARGTRHGGETGKGPLAATLSQIFAEFCRSDLTGWYVSQTGGQEARRNLVEILSALSHLDALPPDALQFRRPTRPLGRRAVTVRVALVLALIASLAAP